MSTTKTVISAASKAMKIVPRRSSDRGHASHGWLNSYHTFSFAQYHDPAFQSFGSLRVLNEDRVAPQSGFPTHPHRDAEIFSYILSGELTHRDSMVSKKSDADMLSSKNDFFRMHRGDVQFTTGGTGIAHSEQNEHVSDEVHFLQIWALPWKKGLPPTYHTETFPEQDKRDRFVTILSPLKAGPEATRAEEKDAVPVIEGTIPIHADFSMGASIVSKGAKASWTVGGGGDGAAVRERRGRKVYVHLPMRRVGAKVRVGGGEVVLGEGDGAFVGAVEAGDELVVESVGEGEAEVVVLDSN
jgi:redox-sensitive bicupin YhaK (pirin superfamily)